MPDVSRSGSAIIHPSNPYAIQDLELGKFTNTNGTVSVNTTSVGGASGYAEGTTVGTATGNVLIFRGTGGTTTAVGTANPLPVYQAQLLAGENLTTNRLENSPRYNYTHIAAALGTTVVKGTAAGLLHTITFNGPATATNVTTVFDVASGTTGAATIAIPAATAVTAPTTAIYDVTFASGLVIECKTAAGGNMTVSWI